MIHEVLPDRLRMYVNQAPYLYKNVSKISTNATGKKLRIQYLGFSE